ncbi:site-specific integrase [Vibrio sp. 10N.261.51.A7]|uniref:site-specific integrase n=1 Tax=Vibrio sp. 10N.261.51.A7 TaxID=1884472 RepID=UPI001A7E1C0D|nr:site-specific integrase [Vibrio sp. 10N.261.51.A7]
MKGIIKKELDDYSKYRLEEGVLEKTVDADKNKIKRAISLINKDIRKWNNKDVRKMREDIYKLPLNLRDYKEYDGLPLHLIMEDISKNNYKSIANETAKSYFRLAKSFYNWLHVNGVVDKDIFKGIHPKKNDTKNCEARDEFSEFDIKLIIFDEVFHNIEYASSFKYWVLLLCIELGLRQAEAAQLHAFNIRCILGVWCVEVKENKVLDQRTKTKDSNRVIPITRNLIRLGFLDFVEDSGDGQIFKDIKPDRRDGWGRMVSRWFTEKKKYEWGFDDRKVFHSFRHTFNNSLKQSDVEEIVAAEIAGHSAGGVTYNRYGKSYCLKKKKKIIEKNTPKCVKKLPRIYPRKNIKSYLNWLVL